MNWLLFFALAACFVATLIVLDNWEHLRTRFSRANEIGRKSGNASGFATAVTGIGRVAGNVTASALSFLWEWKLPLLALAAFVVIAVTISGCVPDWGKSKDTLRAERDSALVDKVVTEHERDVATRAAELAERTVSETVRVREVVAQAEEELEDAVLQADFDRLHAVYLDRYLCVFDAECEGGPDTDPPRPDPVLSPGAHRA